MLFKNQKWFVLNFALILAMLAEMFVTVPAVQASTLTVTNINDSGTGSLRQAIAGAVSGDTITFSPSLTGQTIALASTLIIDKDVTIDGSALASKISVNGNDTVMVLHIVSGTVTLNGLMITNGSSGDEAVGGIQNNGILNIENSTISGNSGGFGGGIQNLGSLNIANSIFSDNTATQGGGILNSGPLNITNSTFSGNLADEGGGILNISTLDITNSTFSENTALDYSNGDGNGGAIANFAELTVTDSLFSSNSAIYDPDVIGPGHGGAIYTQGVLGVLVTNSVFNDNDASRGGAISCDGGIMTITNSTYFSNNASSSAGDGGAIFDNCNSTITNSAFSANTASHNGGAIITDNDINPLVVTNSTFYGNTAFATGGGIANYGGLVVTNSTFSGNSSSNGGAIRNGLGGNLSLRNSILANSVGGVDCIRSDATPEIENISNLIETTGTNLESCGVSHLASDPMLGPLTDNGGPTQTMALSAGSPAIDAGDVTSCPSTDQRGVTRPQGSHCDIGAFEFEPTFAAVDVNIAGNTVGDGIIIPFQTGQRHGFAVDNGPAQVVSTNGFDIIAALRVIWKEPGFRSSYSEMMGLPVEQLSTEYWFPWYNNLDKASMDQGFRIANVDATTHIIRVFLGSTQVGDDIILSGGGSIRVGYEVNDGPIRIACMDCINPDDKIIAALRVIWKEPGLRYSYSEMMGLPKEQLSTEYWFPWYNNAAINSMDQGFRVANVSSTEVNDIEVWVGSTKLDTVSLAAGASIRKGYNLDNGPIRIFCTTCTNTGDDKIIAALRVIWKETGFRSSYSEMMGLPVEQLSTEYWFPWYNNHDTVSMDQGFRMANVDASQHTIRAFLGSTQVGDDIILAGGASIRVGYDVNSGPIHIVCADCSSPDDKIIVALRVIWQEPGIRTGYSEMMGLPSEALSTEYWFPWYNNATTSMDQGFRIAVP